jgi:hypothetical protein
MLTNPYVEAVLTMQKNKKQDTNFTNKSLNIRVILVKNIKH